MGCGSSKSDNLGRNKAEADRYARRKKTGFKDSGLQRHMDDCKNQKKRLRHVSDPAKHRDRKVAKIQQKNKKQAKAGGLATENELQKARKNLKKTR